MLTGLTRLAGLIVFIELTGPTGWLDSVGWPDWAQSVNCSVSVLGGWAVEICECVGVGGCGGGWGDAWEDLWLVGWCCGGGAVCVCVCLWVGDPVGFGERGLVGGVGGGVWRSQPTNQPPNKPTNHWWLVFFGGIEAFWTVFVVAMILGPSDIPN